MDVDRAERKRTSKTQEEEQGWCGLNVAGMIPDCE